MRLSRQGPSLFVQAPAKLNLFLRVLGRRDDGYHNLETLMVSIGLFDSLRFSPDESSTVQLQSGSLCRAMPPVPVDERNLVLKAARLLQAETGSTVGAKITLWKRIPVEAGMGGGSSNAAATLVALNQFWNLNLSSQDLHDLSSRLGSDVNFFVDSPVAAVCTGRGEQVSPIALPQPVHFVVIKPPTGLSTAKVFQTWLNTGSHVRFEIHDAIRALTGRSPLSLSQVLQNDLTPPARQLHHDIDRTLRHLGAMDVLGSGMTGSGSSCFAVCRSARQANAIAGRCRHLGLGRVWSVSSAG